MQTLHNKYYRVRWKILVLCIGILFLSAIILKFLLPDYLVKEDDLQIDSGVIQYSIMNKYPEHDRYGTVYKKCLDVILENKSYYIRFTDQLDSKYWAAIRDTANYSKPIEVKYQARVLHDGILYNPNEVIIDNKVIIPSASKKTFIGLAIIVFTIFVFAGVYFISKLLKLYKEGLYWQDKQIASESKWKLISTWISD